MDGQKGIITKVELTNFMTYDHIVFYPGPYLNVLLGPNGTGKSSIVCAIVLGLGGKPKTIGRSTQLKDYVNNNSGNTAKIMIELNNPDGANYTVEREFNNKNKTSWHLNRRPASQKEVDEFMKSLNIQVDNLCQFLPQDKVQDFAKMNAQQLLENTVKTVGSYDMIESHSTLIKMRENEGTIRQTVDALSAELERAQHKLDSLKSEAEFIKERDKVLQQLEFIKQKKAWLLYKDASDKLKKLIAERETLNNIKCEAEKEIQPFELAVNQVKSTLRSTEKELNEIMGKMGSSLNSVNKKMNEMNRLEESIERINRELQGALQSAKNKEEEIAKLTHSISVFESTNPDPSKEQKLECKAKDLQVKLNVQTADVNILLSKEDNLKQEVRAIENQCRRTEMKINSANDLANEKYNTFKRRNPDAYTLMVWLKENRHKFRGHVFDPIQLEISVRPEYARYVEHTISFHDLEAFICEFNEDVSTLLRIGRDEKNLSVNVISAEGITNTNYQPSTSISNLSAYGFQCYMIDNIEGPKPILNYLCRTYNIHNLPIGNNTTETMLESIPRNVTNFFTGENQHSIRISKYSGAKLSRVTRVRSQAQLLVNSVDTELLQQLKNVKEQELLKFNNFQNELNEVRKELETVQIKCENLKSEKKDVLTCLNELRSARTNVTMKKEELRILKESMVDPEVLKERSKQQIVAVVMQIVSLQESIQKVINDHQGIMLKSKLYQWKHRWAEDVVKRKQEILVDRKSNFDAAKRDLLKKEDEVKNSEGEVKHVYEAARHTTKGLAPKDKQFKERFLHKFNELPNTIKELETNGENIKARIDLMGQGRRQSVEEYERQVDEVMKLKKKLETPQSTLQSLKIEMDAVKVKWMSGLMDLISQINEKYTEFFNRMCCVGEVSLYKPANENCYQDYGIVIRVKFRNSERLRELGPRQQSGGERAVSTAVYMLALQHLTTVPFRCVDEINQGMDEKNERIVYKLLMETTEDAAAAQCFLLTPKLLFDLEFSVKTVVSCIIKGSVNHSENNNRATTSERKRKHLEDVGNRQNSRKRKF